MRLDAHPAASGISLALPSEHETHDARPTRRMKRRERPQVPWLRPVERAEKRTRPPETDGAVYLLQIHPLPTSQTGVLSVAAHLVDRFAAAQHKDVPGLSEDAASFLATRSWALEDLASRVWSAVAENQGSLITAADLS